MALQNRIEALDYDIIFNPKHGTRALNQQLPVSVE